MPAPPGGTSASATRLRPPRRPGMPQMSPATISPAARPWRPATCGCRRRSRAGARGRPGQCRSAPPGVRAPAGQRPAGPCSGGGAGPWTSGAGTDAAVLVLALDAVRTGRNDTAVALFERLGTANIAGPVQPMLLAWARFAAGDRAAAIAQLADEKPETGLERLQAFYRAAMLGLEGRPREGLESWRRRSPTWSRLPRACSARPGTTARGR